MRRLAFAPEERCVSHLGYYFAAWDLPAGAGDLGARPVGYGEPGRLATVGRLPRRTGSPATPAKPSASSPPRTNSPTPPAGHPVPEAGHSPAYEGAGWRTPELLDTLWQADDLYFDAISRVDVPHWSTGRIALLGDAAYGATLRHGTGSAIVGAYVLAGELALAGADHRTAFARYEQKLRPYVTCCQEGGRGAGEFFAPTTQEAIDARNTALTPCHRHRHAGTGPRHLGGDHAERLPVAGHGAASTVG